MSSSFDLADFFFRVARQLSLPNRTEAEVERCFADSPLLWWLTCVSRKRTHQMSVDSEDLLVYSAYV